jgi:hypothetical protein
MARVFPLGNRQASTEVWAQLLLSNADCELVRKFLIEEQHFKPKHVVKNMHITVYHARRPMLGVDSLLEEISLSVPVSDTRFMVMAPGGENPRLDLEPAYRKVGIRVQWQSAAMTEIQKYRERLTKHETPEVLGRRRPSKRRTSAFGARSFQAHMSLLRAGSGVHRDLTIIGQAFRSQLSALHFDRFIIEVVHGSCRPQMALQKTDNYGGDDA